MTELVLVRHGKTNANINGIYCGGTDLPLADKGIKETTRTANALSGDKFDCVYCSDKKRAKQTAQIIVPKLKKTFLSTLKEINFGAFEGLTANEIQETMPNEWQQFMNDFQNFTFPEGDNANDYYNNAVHAIKGIVSAHENKKILVISHKGFIASVLSFYLNGNGAHIFSYDIRPSGFARLDIYANTIKLEQIY